jgi:type II secretory pathway predicted ATPase ExeA
VTSPIAEEIIQRITEADVLYHRLVLVVGPAGAGKTTALQAVQHSVDAPLVNANLELAREMLDLTQRQRTLRVPRLLSNLVSSLDADVVLLDNLELLFDPSLQQDPLRLLQGVSRHKTIVAAWNGTVDNGRLIYAVAIHSEYRSYPIQDFLLVHLTHGG